MRPESRTIRVGDLEVDAERHEVTRDGNRIELNGLSVRLLLVLASHWPNAVDRRVLRDEVWGSTVVSDDTLRQRVRLLRQSLGRSDYVEAVRGFGYRLACPAGATRERDSGRMIALAASLAVAALLAYLLFGDTLALTSIHDIKHGLKH